MLNKIISLIVGTLFMFAAIGFISWTVLFGWVTVSYAINQLIAGASWLFTFLNF